MIRSLTIPMAHALHEIGQHTNTSIQTSCETLPQRVREIMSQHLPEIVAAARVMIQKNNTRSFGDMYTGAAVEWPWLPGYIVKLNDNNQRVIGGNLLNHHIQAQKLDLLKVPIQYPYKLPDGDIHLSVGEKIEGALGKEIPITLPQTEQLISLICRTGYEDPKWSNLVHCPDGTLAIIDTEVGGVPWLYGLHSLLEKNTLVPEANKVFVEVLRKVSPYFRS